MNIFQSHGRLFAAAAVLLFPLHAVATDHGDFEADPPPSLPEPNALQVEVHQGESVQIQLSAFSLTSPIIRYRIREKPHMGALSPAAYVDGKSGIVTYTPQTGAGAGTDEFTYSVQSVAGFSAPAAVQIKIIDSDPILTVPLGLDYGEVVTGTMAKQQIVLQNIGGGTAEGTVQVPDGYTVEGGGDYSLLGGAKQTFTVDFSPKAPQGYSGVIVYTGNPGRATDLKGTGVLPVAIGTAQLALDVNGLQRSGSIPLHNRTALAQTVHVQAGPSLAAPDTIQMPANGDGTIAVQAQPGNYGPIDDAVVLTGDAASGTVRVTAPAVPPRLQLRLEDNVGGTGGALPVVIENHGAPAQVALSASGSFVLADSDRAFRLEPNQKREIGVRTAPDATGTATGQLIATAGGTEAELALATDIPSASAPASGNPAPAQIANTPPPQDAAPADNSGANPDNRSDNRVWALTVKSLSQHDAVLKWVCGVEPASWRLEDQVLELTGTNIHAEWVSLNGAEFTRDKAYVNVHLTHLNPGALYVLRLTALDPKNEPLAVSGILNLQMPAARKSHWLIEAAGVCALALAAFSIWRRRRR